MAETSQRQFKVLRTLIDHERGISGYINREDAEECEQSGWVEAKPNGEYEITEQGRSAYNKYIA